MTILVTRPYESANNLVAQLKEKGYEVILDPLIHLRCMDVTLPSLASFQAIITTSQQAVRCLASLTKDRDFSLWCVGSESAKVAQGFGFQRINDAEGNAHDLIEKIAQSESQKPFLHVSGDVIRVDIVKGLAEKGIHSERLIVYETFEAKTFSFETEESLKAGKIKAVVFYSPRTAAVFQKLCQGAYLESHCGSSTAVCLSESITREILTLPWKKIQVAKKTTTDDLLMALMMAD